MRRATGWPAGGRARGRRWSRPASSSISDPWVEEPVRQIDEEIHERDEESEDEHDPEKERVVAAAHAVDELAAYPGNAVDPLHEERAGDDVRKGDSGEGDHWDEGVLHGVTDDDRGLGQALRACRADEVLPVNLEQARSGVAGEDRGWPEADREDRDDGAHVEDPFPAAGGKPSERDREEHDQERHADERRRREAGDRDER